MRFLFFFINKIKVATIANRNYIYIAPNSFILIFLKNLFLEGFISKINYIKKKNLLKVYLKYSFFGYPIISYLYSFSYQNLKNVIKYNKLVKLSKMGSFFLSTPYGILSNTACLKYKIGGILLVYLN